MKIIHIAVPGIALGVTMVGTITIAQVLSKYTLVPYCVSYIEHTRNDIDEVFPCIDKETKRVQSGNGVLEGGPALSASVVHAEQIRPFLHVPYECRVWTWNDDTVRYECTSPPVGFTTGGPAKPCNDLHDPACADGADGVACNPPGEPYRLNGKLVCIWKIPPPRILQ